MGTNRKTGRIVGVLILIAYGVIGSFLSESKIFVMFLELISAAAIIAMAVLMFPVLKPINKNLALGYAVIKTIDGILIIAAAVMVLSSSPLLLEARDWIYEYGTYLFGIGFLILSYLFYQSKLVPRFISVWGLAASIVFLVSILLNMMFLSSKIPMAISHLPIILNELTLAIWLIVKGFNPSAIASEPSKADS